MAFSGIFHLQRSLPIGSYAKMLVRRVLWDRYRISQEKIPVPRSRIITDVSSLTLHQNVSYISTPWDWNFSCVTLGLDIYRAAGNKFSCSDLKNSHKMFLLCLYSNTVSC